VLKLGNLLSKELARCPSGRTLYEGLRGVPDAIGSGFPETSADRERLRTELTFQLIGMEGKLC